jgi:hypothetical protein
MMVDCLKFPSQIITRSASSSVTSSARRSSCVSRHGFANMHALARREPRHAARRKPVEEFHGRARIGAARVRIPDLRGKKFKEAIGGALSGGDTSHGQITGYFVPPDEYEEFERFRAQRRSFATVNLAEDKVHAVAAARMDPRHDQLVLNYAYLWHGEHRAGLEEGRKDRPSVIVLSITRESDDATIVTVLPITHAAPEDPKAAIEIPLPVKKHLGLDDARSWIVIAEGDEFVWPE